MKTRSRIALSFLLVSGAAIACRELPFPIPPLPINVTSTDVAKAMFAGFDAAHALNGALMRKLDGYGSTAVGDQVWKDNYFKGYLSYSGPLGGQAIAYFEKTCNTTAEEIAKSRQEESTSGGGGGGLSGSGGSEFDGCYTSTESSTGCTSVSGGTQYCTTETWTQLNCPFG